MTGQSRRQERNRLAKRRSSHDTGSHLEVPETTRRSRDVSTLGRPSSRASSARTLTAAQSSLFLVSTLHDDELVYTPSSAAGDTVESAAARSTNAVVTYRPISTYDLRYLAAVQGQGPGPQAENTREVSVLQYLSSEIMLTLSLSLLHAPTLRQRPSSLCCPPPFPTLPPSFTVAQAAAPHNNTTKCSGTSRS